MSKQILISGTEDESPTELEGIFAKLVLREASHSRPSPSARIVTAKKVEEIALLQLRRFVGLSVSVDQ